MISIDVEVTSRWYTVEECEANPKTIYVFGDNMIGLGHGGQAQIRDCVNSFGIPTKRLPSMNVRSFFSDQKSEYDAVDTALKLLRRTISMYRADRIVFPADGLGTGLAKMAEKSPKLYAYLNEKLNEEYEVGYEVPGTTY